MAHIATGLLPATPGDVQQQAAAPAAEVESELAQIPAWAAAQIAHRDGLADVAAAHLAEITSNTELSPGAARSVRHLLVESLVRSRQYEKALASAIGDELPVWRGLALAGLGQHKKALPLLSACVEQPTHPMFEYALLTLVASLRQQGDLDGAVEILQNAGDTSPRRQLILAELHLEQENYDAALKLLEGASGGGPVTVHVRDLLRAEALLARDAPEEAMAAISALLTLPPEALPPKIRYRATLLMADAMAASGGRAKAISLLKGYIDGVPEGRGVLWAFDRLFALDAFGSEEGLAVLRAWTKSPRPAVAMAAQLYAGNIDGRGENRDGAITELQTLAKGDNRIATRAKLLLSELWVEAADKEKALAALKALKASTDNPAVAARIAFVEARAHYKGDDFKTAADRFAAVAEGEGMAVAGSYNAALASLMADDEPAFRARLALLPEVSGAAARGELGVERALYMAANNEPEAREALSEFLRAHKGHPRAVDAHLALAGLYILEWPPKAKSARESLTAARKLESDATRAERADYLAFWIEEGSGEPEDAVRLAEIFIKQWPKSPLAPGVRMRQAEVYFRNGDYLEALRHFEKLTVDYPRSELAEPALFFAGRAAMLTLTEEGSQRALLLWQKLAKSDSPLAPLARRHQAQLKLRQGEQQEALTLLDAILDATPGEPLRTSALMLKGEALYLLGTAKPERMGDAVAVFDNALANPEISTAARNEILFRKGKAHEGLGQMTAALDAYHSVTTAPRKPLKDGETPEFRWFFRSGFESIRILEARKTPQDIGAAIRIADLLADTLGPRSAEARKTAEQLRLENFIWQE